MKCKCGQPILADTENDELSLCYECYTGKIALENIRDYIKNLINLGWKVSCFDKKHDPTDKNCLCISILKPNTYKQLSIIIDLEK